jgi:hypothetical protein
VRNLQRGPSTSTLFGELAGLFAASVATLGLSGCLVAGHSSGGGWFVWPAAAHCLVTDQWYVHEWPHNVVALFTESEHRFYVLG